MTTDPKRDCIPSAEIRRIQAVFQKRENSAVVRHRDDIALQSNQLMVLQAREGLLDLLREHLAKPPEACRILDIGCGYGSLLHWIHEELGVPARQLVGVDLMPSRISHARAHLPSINFIEANAEHMDFPAKSVDLVAVFTVFSSILNSEVAANLARNIRRILVPGGAVMWYDMRYPNFWSRDLRALRRDDISRLFPYFVLHLEPVTLAPPVARRLGRFTRSLYPLLAGFSPFCSHYVGLLVSPDTSDSCHQ